MNTRLEFSSYLKDKLADENVRMAYEEALIHLKMAHLIEEVRTQKGLTQSQLASLARVSQPMIARLERGDQDRIPTLSTISKIMRALGYEVDLVFKKVA